MIRFWCGCGTYLQALSRYAGRDTRCPRCGTVRSIPAHDEDAAPNGHGPALPRLRFDPAHVRASAPLEISQEHVAEETEPARRSAWRWVVALLVLLLLGGGGFGAWYVWLR
jgi:hypothetical protein